MALLLTVLSGSMHAANRYSHAPPHHGEGVLQKPKLIVMIVVDQGRFDLPISQKAINQVKFPHNQKNDVTEYDVTRHAGKKSEALHPHQRLNPFGPDDYDMMKIWDNTYADATF